MEAQLNVAVVQCDAVLGDVGRNLEAHLEQIETARSLGASLVVFPELSLTGYVLRDLTSEVAMRLADDTLTRLREAAREIDVVVGFIEEGDDHQLRNAAAYLSEGDVLHVHRKIYLPTYSMFEEARYWSAGDVVAAFDTPHGRIGILTCEDVWHPSTAYLLYVDRADIVIVPSASPARGITLEEEREDGPLLPGSMRAWEGLLRHQSSAFNLFTVYVNRCGVEDGTSFAGGSRVVDPFGQELVRLGLEAETVVASLDPEVLRRCRTQTPMLRDERLDVTQRNLERIVRDRFDH